MAESAGEKTEDPTEQRKREARKKGTVTKSVDLIGAATLMALLMTLPSALAKAGNALIDVFRGSFSNIPNEVTLGSANKAAKIAVEPLLPALLQIVLTTMLVGVIANFAQVGFHLSSEALVPSFNKLNPINGLKRIFSRVGVFDAAKSLAKALLFGMIAYTSLRARWPELSNLWQLTPYGSLSLIGEVARGAIMKVAFAWLVLALIDYGFQKKQVLSQLKMTKDEVRQEMKQAETSPELKMAMAQRRRKLSQRKTAESVRLADVIITNPTHFAIAIKYEPGTKHAPEVVAKGADFLALKIREIAKEARVPIVENKPLARALYKQCEVGDYVPRELFHSVAEVLAYVYRTIKKVPKS